MSLTRVKSYQLLDSDYKDSVRVATTENVNLAAAPSTVDDIPLAKKDRVLVKNQGNPEENGIYVVRFVGTGSTGTWLRAVDFAANENVTSGIQVPVEEGTINGNRTFQLTTNNPINLGVTGLTFSPVSGGGLNEVTNIGNTTTNGITISSLTETAMAAPSTPAANAMVMYVTTTGTSPNKEVAWKIKNEAGEEIIITSTIV